MEDPAVSPRDQHIGLFLAGLMEGSAVRPLATAGGGDGRPAALLIDILLRDWHFAADAERAAGDF